MRDISGYHVDKLDNGSIKLSRHYNGKTTEFVADNWDEAISWLVQTPAGDNNVFAVCWNLREYSKALFTLLPDEKREEIEQQADRIYYEGCKVFYVNGRYLGLTATLPIGEASNIVRKDELNLQALSWWVSEEEKEPTNAKEVHDLGNRIVEALGVLKFYPTKLTSPVAVFADCYLGDARKYPTIFNFRDDYFEAMEYATEIMRYEWRSAYQVGAFKSTYLYDLNSAYPAVIARLPSTNDCRCVHTTYRPEWSTWGIVRGEIEVTADISPIVYEDEEEQRYNPKGKWYGTFTTREIEWLERWQVGSFKINDGWFFSFDKKKRPYKQAMQWLYHYKNIEDSLLSTIAKKMSQGVSGKLDEDRQDGKKGDYYNPILACMVRSETRIAVADFIYNHNLQQELIAVLVDSVLSTKDLMILNASVMGSWRYEGKEPAIVLSKGNIWRPGKRPQGISYEQLMAAVHKNPESAYYEFKTNGTSTKSIDLTLSNTEDDREYEAYPECGRDMLENIYKSNAKVIDTAVVTGN